MVGQVKPRIISVMPVIKKLLFIAFIATFPAIVFYGYLHFSETGLFPSLEQNVRGFLFSMVISTVIAVVLYSINHFLDKWIPWKKYFSSRFLAGFGSNVILAYSVGVAMGAAIVKLSPNSFWNGLTLKDADLMWKIIILVLIFIFLYNIIYALLYSYQHYAVAQIENLQTERKQLELQFHALKGQISPHYLFNSLNTISSLIYKDIQSAEQFIRRLAQTYQYILATQNKKYVLLKEELDFVRSYYYLLKIRFEQQLTVEINIPASIMNSKIPPLTLQMLVENAVKHNIAASDKNLTIHISAKDNAYVRVENKKTGMPDTMESFKIGLENIRKRYEYFTDREVIVKNEEMFTVALPVIFNKDEKSLIETDY